MPEQTPQQSSEDTKLLAELAHLEAGGSLSQFTTYRAGNELVHVDRHTGKTQVMAAPSDAEDTVGDTQDGLPRYQTYEVSGGRVVNVDRETGATRIHVTGRELGKAGILGSTGPGQSVELPQDTATAPHQIDIRQTGAGMQQVHIRHL